MQITKGMKDLHFLRFDGCSVSTLGAYRLLKCSPHNKLQCWRDGKLLSSCKCCLQGQVAIAVLLHSVSARCFWDGCWSACQKLLKYACVYVCVLLHDCWLALFVKTHGRDLNMAAVYAELQLKERTVVLHFRSARHASVDEHRGHDARGYASTKQSQAARLPQERRLTSNDSPGLRRSIPLLHVLHFPPASVLHLSVPVPLCHGGSLCRGGMPGYSWRQNDLWKPVVCMA